MLRRTILLTVPALGALAPVTGAHAADAIGRVWAVVGRVEARGAGGERLLEVAAAVFVDDTIRTASDARLRIESFGGVTIIVGPSTEMRVERYLTGGTGGLRAAFGLVAGIVRLIGSAVAGTSEIVVETPQAIAAVRSTDWLVDLSAAGTAVFVARGRVAVTSRAGGSVELDPGQGTDVAGGAPPLPPRIWGEARRASALARTTL